MNDISLHLLDIVQNSLTAGATQIAIRLKESFQPSYYTFVVVDNAPGMHPATLANALRSGYTTKADQAATGMGLPLLQQAAEQSGGSFAVQSRKGHFSGTKVTACFGRSPHSSLVSGDIPETLRLLLVTNPTVYFRFLLETEGNRFSFGTAQLYQQFGAVESLLTPTVLQWIRQQLEPFAPALL